MGYAGNPVHNCPNRSRWIDRVFPNLELIVDIDIWMTDTGEYADYVLPDCMPFERYELVNAAATTTLCCRSRPSSRWARRRTPRSCTANWPSAWAWRVFRQDGRRVDRRAARNRLRPGRRLEPKVTFERLKKEKIIRAALPPMPWNPFWGMKFGTPSGRLEFYSERLAPANA